MSKRERQHGAYLGANMALGQASIEVGKVIKDQSKVKFDGIEVYIPAQDVLDALKGIDVRVLSQEVQ